MALEEITKVASGVLGFSQAQATDICVITDPGKGRYRIWGVVRHTLVDGVRLCIGPVAGPTIIIANISSAPGTAAFFGPLVYDINGTTDDIILELATATGGADTASGTLYAQKLVPL